MHTEKHWKMASQHASQLARRVCVTYASIWTAGRFCQTEGSYLFSRGQGRQVLLFLFRVAKQQDPFETNGLWNRNKTKHINILYSPGDRNQTIFLVYLCIICCTHPETEIRQFSLYICVIILYFWFLFWRSAWASNWKQIENRNSSYHSGFCWCRWCDMMFGSWRQVLCQWSGSSEQEFLFRFIFTGVCSIPGVLPGWWPPQGRGPPLSPPGERTVCCSGPVHLMEQQEHEFKSTSGPSRETAITAVQVSFWSIQWDSNNSSWNLLQVHPVGQQ